MFGKLLLLVFATMLLSSCGGSKKSSDSVSSPPCTDCGQPDNGGGSEGTQTGNDVDEDYEFENYKESIYEPFATILFSLDQRDDREFNLFLASIELASFLDNYSYVEEQVMQKMLNNGELLIKVLQPDVFFEVVDFNSPKWSCITKLVHQESEWKNLSGQLKECNL